MCKCIEPAFFMANAFVVCPERTSFELTDMRRMRDDVATALKDENVVIDWTRDSVMAALYYYRDLFRKTGTAVEWVPVDRDADYVKEELGAGLSGTLMEKVSNAIRDSHAALAR